MNAQIAITLAPIASPIILADESYLDHLNEVALQAELLEVNSLASEQTAASILNEATKSSRQIEDKRKELTEPFLRVQRELKTAADNAQTRIQEIKRLVDGKMLAFRRAEEEKARIAEAARQAAERKRLAEEAEARRLKEEADRKAREEYAAALKANEISFEVAPEPEPVAPPPPVVISKPIVAPPKPVGVKYVSTLCFEVIDVNLLPAEFKTVIANPSAIRQRYIAGWRQGNAVPSAPGVKFWVDQKAQGTGR